MSIMHYDVAQTDKWQIK